MIPEWDTTFTGGGLMWEATTPDPSISLQPPFLPPKDTKKSRSWSPFYKIIYHSYLLIVYKPPLVYLKSSLDYTIPSAMYTWCSQVSTLYLLGMTRNNICPYSVQLQLISSSVFNPQSSEFTDPEPVGTEGCLYHSVCRGLYHKHRGIIKIISRGKAKWVSLGIETTMFKQAQQEVWVWNRFIREAKIKA